MTSTSHTARGGRDGFTIVEVMVVVGFMAILLAITSQSLFRGQQRTSLTETSNGIVRDLRQQQILVMQGRTAGDGVISDYSVRFEDDRYILYPGIVYDSGNPNNQVVLLEPTMRFSSVSLPDGTIIFARGSGEVRNFDAGQASVTLSQDQTDSAKTIRVNRMGVVFLE